MTKLKNLRLWNHSDPDGNSDSRGLRCNSVAVITQQAQGLTFFTPGPKFTLTHTHTHLEASVTSGGNLSFIT